jgi:AmmeMemoRadiSam system protein A
MGASFVTLMAGGHLRGCIGSLEAYRPLHDDVPANALAAAFHDPRFAPLGSDELDAIRIEVSVLSTPVPMAFASEADALRKLRPGIDGVILEARDRRATFLPQVWADLPDPAIFIRHLKRKAGLWAEYWQDIRLWRYTVTAFREPE